MVFGSLPEMVWNSPIPLPFCYQIQPIFRRARATMTQRRGCDPSDRAELECERSCAAEHPLFVRQCRSGRTTDVTQLRRAEHCACSEARLTRGRCLEVAEAIRREIPGVLAEQLGDTAKHAGLDHHALVHLIVLMQV